MKNNHEIILKQYAAYCKEQPLYLGTAGSYGMEMLTIIREGVWAEYDILAAFHPPVGAAVQVRVGANNQIGVPIEATAEKGMGEIVFAGYKEGVRQIAVDVLYKVAPSSGASGTEPAEPTPDVVQQILSAANGAVKTADGVREDMDKMLEAESKRAAAETARKDAESSRVKAEAEREKQLPALKSSVDELRARQNILAGSKTGNPVSCNDAYSAPLCGLTVYGKSTQDGTPTPDAPVPIVSAGDGGTIAVTLSDGNGKAQTLTLPTPTGLPGIPVASGGNYTDPQGQQWVCDEIDLKKGVKVQRIASFVIDAKNANDIFVTNPYTHVTVATNTRLKTPQKTNRDVRFEKCVFCEALPWSKNQWANTVNSVNFVENDSVDLTFENSYLRLNEASTDNERKTALVKYFTDNPCQVVYRIATPIETPLTPDEIAAYKALTAYAPDTVVQASDGAGIKLDYQRDVNLVVKNLEDAIASMTTT